MELLPSRDKTASQRFQTIPSASEGPSTDQHGGLVSEQLFARMLCLERKRAERSHKSLLLMLLDAEALFQGTEGAAVLERIATSVVSSTRETDVGGWYKSRSILGVLFTELTERDRREVSEALLSRMTAALASNLSSAEFREISISLRFFPEEWDMEKPGRPLSDELYPDLFRSSRATKFSRLLKRTMDLVGSILALLILSPLLVLIAALIKLTSRGPALFRQNRVGQYGATFELLKFRSMHTANDPNVHKKYVEQFISGKTDSQDASRLGPAVYKIREDPRVTSVGRWLRRSSLDELPQFWNVLKGEMSLVGPRPPIPYELDHYDTWHRRRVLEAKPGITGLWQVHGRSKTSFDEMVRLDLQYAKSQSLWLDLKILVKTPGAVLSGVGAY